MVSNPSFADVLGFFACLFCVFAYFICLLAYSIVVFACLILVFTYRIYVFAYFILAFAYWIYAFAYPILVFACKMGIYVKRARAFADKIWAGKWGFLTDGGLCGQLLYLFGGSVREVGDFFKKKRTDCCTYIPHFFIKMSEFEFVVAFSSPSPPPKGE